MSRFLIFLLLCCSTISFGQYDMDEATDTTTKEQKVNPYTLKQRIYVGGDVSLSFGSGFYLYLGPFVGYDLWKGISAGIGTMYQLRRSPPLSNGTILSSHAYGGGVFARYRPPVFPYLLVQTEFMLYNAEDLTSPLAGSRATIPAWNSGLGYAGGGDKIYYQIMLMFDAINHPSNPLPNLFSDIPVYLRYGIVVHLE